MNSFLNPSDIYQSNNFFKKKTKTGHIWIIDSSQFHFINVSIV